MARRKKTPASQEDDAASSISEDEIQEVAPPAASAQANTDEGKKARFAQKYKTSEKTNEEILEKQQAAWRSPIYKHFKPPRIIIIDGEVKYIFECESNPLAKLTRARWDDSTSNLVRHVNACEKNKKPPPGQKAIDSFAQGTTYQPAKFRYKLAIWIARRHRPYTIAQDPEFIELLQMLNAKVEVPHPTTVSRDVREIFSIARAAIGKLLQEHPGHLHLCLDGWTSPNVISFLGITVHRVHEGKAVSFILDFVKLTKAHTGVYLSEKLTECLTAYGIQDKILGITADNASNNMTMVEDLETSLGGINSRQTRVRCFAHILNLVVKAIISPFMRKKKAAVDDKAESDDAAADEDTGSTDDNESESEDDESSTTGAGKKRKSNAKDSGGRKKSKTTSTPGSRERLSEEDELRALEEEGQDIDEDNVDFSVEDDEDGEDEDELDADAEAYDEEEIEALIAEIQGEYDLSAAEQRFARYTVTKIVELAKRVFHSPTIRADLKSCCVKEKTADLQMIRAIPTRWNSLAQAIRRALQLRVPLTRLLKMPKYSKKGKKGLKRFYLDDNEWDLLEDLYAVLAMFIRATERVSQSNIPLLHDVIPLIDIITSKLVETMEDVDLPTQVRYGAALGFKLLNKYYSATDESVMYRCAMMLHPKHKLEYFRNQKWKPDWIATAEELLRTQWEMHYKPKPNDSAPTTASQSQTVEEDIFASLDVTFTLDGDDDVLDNWLQTPTVPTCTDPLGFWEARRKDGGVWVPLACMALDFLSVPAASTDVERAFSRGGLTVSKRRHSLNNESTRAATVVSSWAAIPGLLPESKIIKMFGDKSKRSKKKDEEGDIEVIE